MLRGLSPLSYGKAGREGACSAAKSTLTGRGFHVPLLNHSKVAVASVNLSQGNVARESNDKMFASLLALNILT